MVRRRDSVFVIVFVYVFSILECQDMLGHHELSASGSHRIAIQGHVV